MSDANLEARPHGARVAGDTGLRRADGRVAPGLRRTGLFGLLRQTLAEVKSDRVLVLSGSLSYCTALSLAPLVIVTLGLVGLFMDRGAVQEHVVSQIDAVIGPQGAQLLGQIAESQDGPGGERRGMIGTIIGLVTLLFGATAVFAQLQNGLNIIWDVEPIPGSGLWGFVRKRLVSLAMVVSLGFLLLVSLLASAALSAATAWLSALTGAEAVVGVVLHVVVSLAVFTLLFALMFHYVPDAETTWRDTWPGAAFTAALFIIGEWAIGQYLGRAGVGSAYGAAGSLVVLLVWVYYSSVIVFAGAEFVQVWATQRGSGIVPDKHAKRENPASALDEREGAACDLAPGAGGAEGADGARGAGLALMRGARGRLPMTAEDCGRLMLFTAAAIAWIVAKRRLGARDESRARAARAGLNARRAQG
jgi:membrane protein